MRNEVQHRALLSGCVWRARQYQITAVAALPPRAVTGQNCSWLHRTSLPRSLDGGVAGIRGSGWQCSAGRLLRRCRGRVLQDVRLVRLQRVGLAVARVLCGDPVLSHGTRPAEVSVCALFLVAILVKLCNVINFINHNVRLQLELRPYLQPQSPYFWCL